MRASGKSDLQKFRKFLKNGMPGPHAYVVLLGLNQFDWPGVIERIEKGLPYSSLERLQRNSGFTTDQLIDLLQIPKRTLARRKASGRLSAEESDRLVRLARVFAKALHLFGGDADQTIAWLTAAQRAFRGTTPLEMARTEIGAQEVERLVFQLEHGVLP
ncbi:MAG TPA: antitoxin Xre-like helix-turn-helix domain-containing protein [Thermoanaerobaculia bacterium]|nr:antitoxin Xre-like helix-turn-helix domain-containing protein [Thermoanaerobaculia bacterium]